MPVSRRFAHQAAAVLRLVGSVSLARAEVPHIQFTLAGPGVVQPALSLFEDGEPDQGAGSKASVIRSKTADGVEAGLKLKPETTGKRHATGSFSGVLVLPNRKSRPATERSCPLSTGCYSLTATESK